MVCDIMQNLDGNSAIGLDNVYLRVFKAGAPQFAILFNRAASIPKFPPIPILKYSPIPPISEIANTDTFKNNVLKNL